MKRWLGVAPVLVILSACSPSPVAERTAGPGGAPSPQMISPAATPSAAGPIATATAAATPSPAPGPSATPSAAGPPALGVLVDLLSNPATYTISLARADGGLAGQVTAKQRRPIVTAGGHAVTLPYVSTSLTSLYYLDGDADVRVLHAGGTTASVMTLEDVAGVQSTFAVSPDDRQIAITSLDYNTAPVHVTLTVDALYGGSPRRIFESNTDYVWPVAWRSGLLVLAHAYGPFEEDIAKVAPGRDNPYSAVSYHVVDPANANRVVLMGSCTVSGPLSPAGSGCIQGGAIDWRGNAATWGTTDWGSISAAAALSPNGDWMAAARPDAPTLTGIWRSDGTVANYLDGPGPLDWAGWLDGETVVIGSYANPNWEPEVVNVVRGGIVHTIAAHGFFAAALPTDVA